MGKGNVFIHHPRGILQIGIDKVLQLTVIKKIDPHNLILLIGNTNHDIGIIRRVAVGQGADVFEKFGLPFFVAQVDFELFVIKAVFIIVGQKGLDEQPFVDHDRRLIT